MVFGLLPTQCNGGAIVVIVDRLIAKLCTQVEIAQFLDLLNPPILSLKIIGVSSRAEEQDILRLKEIVVCLRIIDTIDKEIATRGQHLAHAISDPLAGLAEVVGNPGISSVRQFYTSGT